ncbi:DUF4231 domain-containing protein, partial [Providencia rettgeri]|nr:DUF4231 domain-containing protein [Providencia rettgeri]
YRDKASHNKNETLWCFRLIMFCSIFAPIFFLISDELIYSKLIPSCMSAVAAFCTAWVQLRKPQNLWALYKTSERELEVLKINYLYNSNDFSNCSHEDKDRIFIEKITDTLKNTNLDWARQVYDYKVIKSN